MKLVRNIGFNDGTRPASIKRKRIKEYELWVSMLGRCCDYISNSKNDSYVNCKISENFKNYSYFYDWCQNQIGFRLDNWDLDKDLLIKGNNLYSENNCIFLPREINALLVSRKAKRGKYPIGVCFVKSIGKFQSQVSINGRQSLLGFFDDPYEAFIKYKTEKEKHIKMVADKWRDNIDPRAYEALLQYVVDIDD